MCGVGVGMSGRQRVRVERGRGGVGGGGGKGVGKGSYDRLYTVHNEVTASYAYASFFYPLIIIRIP